MSGFSVIIPTLERTSFLLDTLSDLQQQQASFPFEIIIVDQSAKADTAVMRIAGGDDRLRYVHIDFFKGLPQARNYGASVARYEYLLFLDDDIRCKPDLLEQHYRALAQPDIGLVAGGITEAFLHNKNQPVGRFNKWTATPTRGFHQDLRGAVDHAGGGNFSVRSQVYQKATGVDELLTKGAALYEETDFCLRVKEQGYDIWFEYGAHVTHLAADTGGCRVPDIERYMFSLCRNRSLIISRHLKWYARPVAHLYLLKMVVAYGIQYKKATLFASWVKGVREGSKLGRVKPKDSFG